MDPADTAELIESAGGDAAFAKLLGIEDQPGVAQRVNNWKRRGIPSSVELNHYDTISKLRQQVARKSVA